MAAHPDPGGEARNLHLLAHTDLDGHGDCMHVEVHEGFAYVGHMGGDRVGTSVLDVSDPRAPRLVTQILTPPGTHSHKVQVLGDLLLVNHERNPSEPDAHEWSAGLACYDISRPWRPEQIGFLPMPGAGVHRMTYDVPPYAYMSGSDAGFEFQFLVVADLSDPAAPAEAGRWWLPGMRSGEQRDWPDGHRYKLHHAIVRGDRAYASWWDAGLVILDVTDPRAPALVSRLDFGHQVSRATHTTLPLPGRDLLIVTDEALSRTGTDAVPKDVRIVDISDERHPRVVGLFPVPAGDYAGRGGRFGPHNLHEMRAGSFQSARIVHLTYFSGGLRVYDVSDASHPAEVASYVPAPPPGRPTIQLNDLTVTPDGLIYVTDRTGGGLYILEPEIELR